MRIFSTMVLTLVSFFAFCQNGEPTIVSKNASYRNVLIEDVTGSGCGYCPCAHMRVNDLIESNPGMIWGINIHAEKYATVQSLSGSEGYTTNVGTEIASGLSTRTAGYPSISVNRYSFSNFTNYGSVATYAQEVANMTSPVNVALKVQSLNYNTREVKILVEVYYTGNTAGSTNYINLAILQNNILGPQNIYQNCSYPENMVGSKYKHNHMLRHMITGTWGNAITTTSAGTFWDSTYTYIIPENYNNVPVVLSDLEFIAFVAVGHQDVLNCYGVKAPAATSISENNVTNSIKMYPSPANENANIVINSDKNSFANIIIYNTLGQIVYTSSNQIFTGENLINVNTTSFDNGIYLVKIDTEGNNLSSKFIVSR